MVTGDGRGTSDEVGLVGVAAQVGSDERTQGDELEPAGAEVLQGAGDQPLAQPLALEGGVDLGVDQDHPAWLGPVLDQPGSGRSQPELVARRPRIVGDSGFCRSVLGLLRIVAELARHRRFPPRGRWCALGVGWLGWVEDSFDLDKTWMRSPMTTPPPSMGMLVLMPKSLRSS